MDSIDWTAQTGALTDARSQLIELDSLAQRFGTSMTRAFASGIAQGRSFEDVLRSVGQKFVEIGLRAGLQPLSNLTGSLMSQLTQGLSGALTGAFGGGAAGGPITPFADGGVIAAPGYFPLGRGMGLAGEAGPEAILPLARGSDGRLGVAASGTGGGASVFVTIQTPDIDGFRKAESQISAQLARAVARGRRGT